MILGTYDVIMTSYEKFVIHVFSMNSSHTGVKLTKKRSQNTIMIVSKAHLIIITIYEKRKIYEIMEIWLKFGNLFVQGHIVRFSA